MAGEGSSVRVGSESLQFELVTGWEQLPEDIRHADVAAVTTDSDGNVYLLCRGDHPVLVYDSSGRLIDTWGAGRFSYRTHGMFMTGSDELYIVDDGGNSVGRYSRDGALQQLIGPAGVPSDSGYDGRDLSTITHGAEPYNRPTGISVAPSGKLFVSDGYGNSRVHRFSEAGDLETSFGEPGVASGEFSLPHCTWAADDGRIFVADRQNDRIQIFDENGQYLAQWLDVQRPQSIFIDRDGLVYVAELGWREGEVSQRHGHMSESRPARLSIYDLDGNLILRWSDPDPMKNGYFIAPHGIWVDAQGSLYVAEATHTIAVIRNLAPPDAHTFQKFARI